MLGFPAVKKALLLAVGLVTVLLGLAAFAFHRALVTPGPQLAEPARVFIRPGSTLTHTARLLADAGVLDDERTFRLWARLTGKDRGLQSGEYVLTEAVSPCALLDILAQGRVARHAITIPEGLTFEQIAGKLEAEGFGPEASFLALGSDARFLARWELQDRGVEGYVYPDTYFFTKPYRPEEILGRMLDRLNEVYTPAMQQRADALGWSRHEVLTLASLVEKETGAAAERALIAGVFHNRLRRRIPLQCDPTVIYGLADFDGNLTRAHLRTPGPYNTYLNRGLPPGPIANPGLAAIEASLSPAETDYLYFVAKGDGTHVFSARLADHNRAVYRFQKRRTHDG